MSDCMEVRSAQRASKCWLTTDGAGSWAQDQPLRGQRKQKQLTKRLVFLTSSHPVEGFMFYLLILFLFSLQISKIQVRGNEL